MDADLQPADNCDCMGMLWKFPCAWLWFDITVRAGEG